MRKVECDTSSKQSFKTCYVISIKSSKKNKSKEEIGGESLAVNALKDQKVYLKALSKPLFVFL
jgi:hypothetical protein